MNYRHLYHAGNFADVLKHIVLLGLIEALLRKETPFFFLDTHAGAGHYDLLSESAQKSKEFENGINKVLNKENPPELVQRYLNYLPAQTPPLPTYPGSPFFVRPLLRAQDRIIATELNPRECRALASAVGRDRQLMVREMDGYQGLKAFLPPKERRGLVLIDPPYENPDEFSQLIKALTTALDRWETGIYALWYPIKERRLIDQFHKGLVEAIKREMLVIELCIYPEDVSGHLNGCGMLIVNPPWKFDQEMNSALPWLWSALAVNNQGSYRHYSLKTPL